MNTFENSLLMNLHRTLDSIIPKYRAVFKKHRISEQQWRILSVLSVDKKCTTLDLSSKTLIPGPSLVGIIDRMSGKGLVSRDRSAEDRRIIYVQLDKKGRALVNELSPQVDLVNEQIISKCDVSALLVTTNTLKRISGAADLDISPLKANLLKSEAVEAERVEAERVEAERVEAERVEAERVEAERVEAERVEAERVEAERVETVRIEAEKVDAVAPKEGEEADIEKVDELQGSLF